MLDPEFEAGVPSEAVSLVKGLKGHVGAQGSMTMLDAAPSLPRPEWCHPSL
jgi:hypothetical protein